MYPPPYERPVCFNEKADAELIGWALSEFDWIRALSHDSVDEKFCYFTKTLLI